MFIPPRQDAVVDEVRFQMHTGKFDDRLLPYMIVGAGNVDEWPFVDQFRADRALEDYLGASVRGRQGVGLPSRAWLLDPDLSLWSVMAAAVWQDLGYNILVFLAGLQFLADRSGIFAFVLFIVAGSLHQGFQREVHQLGLPA